MGSGIRRRTNGRTNLNGKFDAAFEAQTNHHLEVVCGDRDLGSDSPLEGIQIDTPCSKMAGVPRVLDLRGGGWIS